MNPPDPTSGHRFDGIGRALRLLRLRRGRKQYEVAGDAEITKAMLSAYETGKRMPSLPTLAALLDALEADLGDLHRALVADLEQDRALAGDDRPYPAGPPPASAIGEGHPDVYRTLGLAVPLPAAEERALSEMLHGFHSLLRYFHRRMVDDRPYGRA